MIDQDTREKHTRIVNIITPKRLDCPIICQIPPENRPTVNVDSKYIQYLFTYQRAEISSPLLFGEVLIQIYQIIIRPKKYAVNKKLGN
jgi:hypothetical protein